MQVPEGYVQNRKGRITVLVREDWAHTVDGLGLFDSNDPKCWKGAAGTLKGGRGETVRIGMGPESSLIVKPLLRGGVIRMFNRCLHLTMNRIFHEAALSRYMVQKGIPAASMILGRAEWIGFFLFRLHLGTEEIRGSVSLLDLLRNRAGEEALNLSVFRSAGRSVRSLHDAGIYHNDLNLGNLLAPLEGVEDRDHAVWLIDLDRSVIQHPLTRKARCSNLARLYRHAVKNGIPQHLDLKRLWRGFLEGYCGAGGQVSSLEEDVERSLKGTLFFHRISWFIQGR